MACSPTGSSVHGIFQERLLEWVAIPFSSESFQPRDCRMSQVLQAISLPLSHQGRPRDYTNHITKEIIQGENISEEEIR